MSLLPKGENYIRFPIGYSGLYWLFFHFLIRKFVWLFFYFRIYENSIGYIPTDIFIYTEIKK